jgi:hypothetical protein
MGRAEARRGTGARLVIEVGIRIVRDGIHRAIENDR